jgi:hypothetical protein
LVVVLAAMLVAAAGCSRDDAKTRAATVDAAPSASASVRGAARLVGKWKVADASEMLGKLEGAERERVAANVNGMTWEFTNDQMFTYQDHHQTHEDRYVLSDETADSATLTRGDGVRTQLGFLPGGKLRMPSPWGNVILERL